MDTDVKFGEGGQEIGHEERVEVQALSRAISNADREVLSALIVRAPSCLGEVDFSRAIESNDVDLARVIESGLRVADGFADETFDEDDRLVLEAFATKHAADVGGRAVLSLIEVVDARRREASSGLSRELGESHVAVLRDRAAWLAGAGAGLIEVIEAGLRVARGPLQAGSLAVLQHELALVESGGYARALRWLVASSSGAPASRDVSPRLLGAESREVLERGRDMLAGSEVSRAIVAGLRSYDEVLDLEPRSREFLVAHAVNNFGSALSLSICEMLSVIDTSVEVAGVAVRDLDGIISDRACERTRRSSEVAPQSSGDDRRSACDQACDPTPVDLSRSSARTASSRETVEDAFVRAQVELCARAHGDAARSRARSRDASGAAELRRVENLLWALVRGQQWSVVLADHAKLAGTRAVGVARPERASLGRAIWLSPDDARILIRSARFVAAGREKRDDGIADLLGKIADQLEAALAEVVRLEGGPPSDRVSVDVADLLARIDALRKERGATGLDPGAARGSNGHEPNYVDGWNAALESWKSSLVDGLFLGDWSAIEAPSRGRGLSPGVKSDRLPVQASKGVAKS